MFRKMICIVMLSTVVRWQIPASVTTILLIVQRIFQGWVITIVILLVVIVNLRFLPAVGVVVIVRPMDLTV
ncbi:hypothetical protein A3K34_03855 [candidate division WWE3 bacterium RIFOXYC1_FULL_40_10]|nr:MAG: hypothetical protein A3K58_03855 [candidate division WWE3 bacterium RIFOXYB1_FULL_40_22]OGC61975.1 MAG: hypothetical protein A3K37_03855 [candidate division WWE3 bacterium RIFOXYA1_FULL_40_11]OGC66358.1 MAG: hypothetical protein A3K34_03855 [candidate division WWE3 bacterium RIFOXYC1_FULL_40_10]